MFPSQMVLLSMSSCVTTPNTSRSAEISHLVRTASSESDATFRGPHSRTQSRAALSRKLLCCPRPRWPAENLRAAVTAEDELS
ncbi:hypothetical protein INR49_008595 [Caranx melampygus]|nr:hypothetical protein INR49_008595 [Caranx melampygus]